MCKVGPMSLAGGRGISCRVCHTVCFTDKVYYYFCHLFDGLFLETTPSWAGFPVCLPKKKTLVTAVVR